MQRKVILTSDGSYSIEIPELNVTYHSIHGAIQESTHVYIEAGLKQVGNSTNKQINILEIGLGTGLNALLTFIEAEKSEQKIYYETIEPYPLNQEEIKDLNYCRQLNRPDIQPLFEKFHFCDFDKETHFTPLFTFRKSKTNLLNVKPVKPFELIYFDAFAPNAQPELWTTEVFDKMYSILLPQGILVTYCSKGDVRRAMQAAGFKVEKIPGAKGKREMIRGRKSGKSYRS